MFLFFFVKENLENLILLPYFLTPDHGSHFVRPDVVGSNKGRDG